MNFYPICLNCATERRTYLGPGTSSASSGRSPRIRVDTPGFRTPGSRLDSTRGPAVTRGVQLQGFDFAMFQAGSGGAGFQVASQKSGPVASDVPRLAPPNTVTNGRDPFNFNGLRAMEFPAETVFLESRSSVALPRTTHVQNENGERRLPDALSPSCLLDSTDLLQMSRRKMLQAVGVTDDSVDPRSWPTTPATSATQWYDPPLTRH